MLTWIASFVFQGGSEKDSPKKGDKTDRAKSPPKGAKQEAKKSTGAGDTAASPKTESKLKKRGEVELEGKFISK